MTSALSDEQIGDAYAEETLLLQQDARVTDRVLGQRGMHLEELVTAPAPRPFTNAMRLAAEILRQAFADLEHDRGAIRDEAAAWFEEEDSETPHCFHEVCVLLALDAANIRQAATDPDRRRAINVRLRKEWNEGGRKA
jgi:hypothetical protein